MRKLLAAVAAMVGLVAGPIAFTETGSAGTLNVTDLGVYMEVAQAVFSPDGNASLVWQSTSEVVPGAGTLIRARAENASAVPQLGLKLTVNTGAPIDPEYTINGCAGTVATAGQTVTCTTSGGPTGWVYIGLLANTAGTLHHSATASGTPGELLQLPLEPEAPDSASARTTVDPDSEFAFLTDGESASQAGGGVNQTFTVPEGATNGGGVFVHLYTGNGSDTSCGTGGCYGPEARADFVQSGGTPVSDTNPFTISVNYPGVTQSCNGLGGPSGCNPIFYIRTAAGVAAETPKCSTYGPNGGTPNTSTNDPCVYSLERNGNGPGETTYHIALKTDIGFPILGLPL